MNIRPATANDIPGIWELIRELAIYEKAPHEFVITLEQLAKDFADKQFFAFVAEKDNEIVGMALGYNMYSTWKGLSVYLEDIVVREANRRSGIGSKLFEAVAQYARETNAGKMVWQVLDWNVPAVEFYKKYNANFDEEWKTCRFSREQLEGFSGK